MALTEGTKIGPYTGRDGLRQNLASQ